MQAHTIPSVSAVTPSDILDSAIARIESKSIQVWANDPHNRPLWLQFTESHVGKYGTDTNSVIRLSTLIMCEAIGL